MKLEIGRKYRAILADNSEIIFIVIGGANVEIELNDGTIIPLIKLPRYKKIEELVED